MEIAVIEYGKNGNVISTGFLTHEKNNASQVLNEVAKENPIEGIQKEWGFTKSFQNPQNKTYCFAMTQDSLSAFMENYPEFITVNQLLYKWRFSYCICDPPGSSCYCSASPALCKST